MQHLVRAAFTYNRALPRSRVQGRGFVFRLSKLIGAQDSGRKLETRCVSSCIPSGNRMFDHRRKKEKGSGMYSCVVAKQEYTSIKNTGEFYLSK